MAGDHRFMNNSLSCFYDPGSPEGAQYYCHMCRAHYCVHTVSQSRGEGMPMTYDDVTRMQRMAFESTPVLSIPSQLQFNDVITQVDKTKKNKVTKKRLLLLTKVY